MNHDVEEDIIIAGHDRGARICHRLAVDNDDYFAKFIILGVVLLDIVPTLVQWQTFSNSKASMGSFHWPLLANVELATSMIMALGGDKWCQTSIQRWAGNDPNGFLGANEAMETYSYYMAQESVIRSSCRDYQAGAEEDLEAQKQDQASNRKLAIDTMVIYSDKYLGSRYDIEGIWMEWSKGHSKLRCQPVRNGAGHFIAEETPRQTAAAINLFLTHLMPKDTQKNRVLGK